MVGTGGTQLEKGVQGKAVHVSVGDVWLVQRGLSWRRVFKERLYIYGWEMYGWYRNCVNMPFNKVNISASRCDCFSV